MIGLESELLTKTGLIIKGKALKEDIRGRKANGAQEV